MTRTTTNENLGAHASGVLLLNRPKSRQDACAPRGIPYASIRVQFFPGPSRREPFEIEFLREQAGRKKSASTNTIKEEKR
jgi:hypothetical protein